MSAPITPPIKRRRMVAQVHLVSGATFSLAHVTGENDELRVEAVWRAINAEKPVALSRGTAKFASAHVAAVTFIEQKDDQASGDASTAA